MHSNNVSNRGRGSEVFVRERGRGKEKWCLFRTTTSHKTNNVTIVKEKRKELSERESVDMEETLRLNRISVGGKKREEKNISCNVEGWCRFFNSETSHLKFKFKCR